MADIIFLFSGLIIGLSIAAPVGPIGILCIRRTILYGKKSGFVSGLGAASADGVYGSLIGFGVGFLTDFLLAQHIWIQLVGGAALLVLGIVMFLSRPSDQNQGETERLPRMTSHYFSTFLFTLANPMTILLFMALFTSLGIGNSSHRYINSSLVVIGVFLGSALWWLILSNIVIWIKKVPGKLVLEWIGRVSGAIIIGFGIFGIVNALIAF